MKLSYELQRLQVVVILIEVCLFLVCIGFGSVFAEESKPELNRDPKPVAAPAPQPETESKVILEPGDVLDIKFFYAAGLNETQTVRPDGKITLQLVDEVEVQGKTPAEVRDELIKLYSSKLKETEIAVIVNSLRSRVVYVSGEVNRPGVIEMSGRLTALEAIMRASGFNTEFARVNKVVVIRRKDGQWHGVVLDFRDVLAGKGTQKPFYLEPHDIVYVPR